MRGYPCLCHGKVQWVSASLGHFFATIGGDNKLKIWQEDPSQRLNGGRRFRCICSQTPLNHVSYVSFGFKSTRSDLWLALMTHDGLLSVFEPADPETLSLWTTLDQLYPFGHHRRGTEARFRLSWHQSEGPSSNALLAGVGPKTLSIAVSALNYVKILRAALLEHVPEATYQFDEMIQMETGNALINEIAWAPGCLRPFDVVATACDDGTVRVFHVDTPCDVNEASEAKVTTPRETCTSQQKQPLVARNVPSGIGAGLAGLSRIKQGTISKTSIKHVSREAAALSHDESSPVWKVRWIYDGKVFLGACLSLLSISSTQ